MTSILPVRIALTVLLALAAALLCVRLDTPIPWMIGPLVATSAASMLGWPTRSFGPFRHTAQWTIATALGLYFTPQVTELVASPWWAISLSSGWALALAWGFGVWLNRVNQGRIGFSKPFFLPHGTPNTAAHGARRT